MQNIRAHAKQILIAAAIVVAVFLLLDYQSRLKQLSAVEAQRDIVAQDVVELRQTQKALEQKLEYAKSDAMVEQFARIDLNAGQAGDVRIIPHGSGGATPTPVPTIAATPDPVENWEVWQALIFKQ